MHEHPNTLAEMLTGKREFLRLIVLATVLSFSVGVLASLVAATRTVPTIVLYIGAALLTVVALLILAVDIRRKLSFEDRHKGIIFIDSAENEIVDVRGYELATDLCKVMAAVRAESRAIYADWENDPLVPKKVRPESPPAASNHEKQSEGASYISILRINVENDHLTNKRAAGLVDEALQFVLIEELSTHLSTYFNNDESDQIAELSREDIPSFLLKNRVLNLLTTPIEQRDVFLKAFPRGSQKPDGVLYSLWGSDGSMYSRFDLTLPKDSKVSFLGRGSLGIQTKRLDLEISGRYMGGSIAVSPEFVRYYMNKTSGDVACRTIEVVLKGRIRPLALLTSKGWEHYRCLD